MLITAAIILLCAGLVGLYSIVLKRLAGVPSGIVVYSDVGCETVQGKALVSHRYRLAGRPDYLIKGKDGIIPVECKSGPSPWLGPHFSHQLQLAAYCLLLEEQGIVGGPPYGVIRYRDRSYRVNYSRKLRDDLLNTLASMQSVLWSSAESVNRSHSRTERCRQCGWQKVCGQSLAEL
jgi:CRISPR-associated exonuclease Cas4